ncbi:hypothetical protein MBM_01918 [Drepanopeziza brunnea f. sp. 'multigermtubi' MB_m1]|uniref:Uncharacterized protein n=1 Tax=Marssonina brunnea f. sp. multigermtubi (strain MB_m1) TaxID=1072389 RepID=K1X420_MARBU|nr:uncharacterized protein MBM_01918 [Drepanopeziza brunnea f. sp. 'multigermtubi' MB_m1]EKD19966.1 hypothetical protein MBM_01918 [Drepanopeziza brunnea f. sp. 'multigermtubi' MB_m1]
MACRLQSINSALSNTPKQNDNQHRICLESNSSTQHPAHRVMCVVIYWFSAGCSLHTSWEFKQCNLADFKGGCQMARVEKSVRGEDCADCEREAKEKENEEAVEELKREFSTLVASVCSQEEPKKKKEAEPDGNIARPGCAGPVVSGFETLSNLLQSFAHQSWVEGKIDLLEIEAEACRPARDEEPIDCFKVDYDFWGDILRCGMKHILDAARDEMIKSCGERDQEFFEIQEACKFPPQTMSLQPNTKHEIIVATRALRKDYWLQNFLTVLLQLSRIGGGGLGSEPTCNFHLNATRASIHKRVAYL